MLESLLIGLITGGVYYLAQRHREYLKQKQIADVLSQEHIRSSLENGLKSVFPKLSKDLAAIKGIDEEQIRYLQELFYRSDGELELKLRETIEQNLYELTSAQQTTATDMFSIDGMKNTMIELKEEKKIKHLKLETISFAVPKILVRMIQEISIHPALINVYGLIREIQNDRFHKDLEKYFKLDDETILNAINTLRRNLKAQTTQKYNIKMAGSEPDVTNRFDYMPPQMRRLKKPGNKIPIEFEGNTEPINTEQFMKIFLDQKKVIIIAGAGVGKTTFLYRMQLELMQKRLKSAPIPVFENVKGFFADSSTLFDRMTLLLQKTKAVDFSPEKASRIAGMLDDNGRLCYLLDSLDQCTDIGSCRNCFQMDSLRIFGKNRVVVSSRIEHIKRDPEIYRDIFADYEWVILDGFSERQLLAYLGPQIVKWLDYERLPENFKGLLKTPFYANITRRIGLRPDSDRIQVENRSQLLGEFERELYREAKRRGVTIHELDEFKIKGFLYDLSLEALAENHIQTFPRDFLERYKGDYSETKRIVFDADWVFFNRTLFEGKDENSCTFYHQLLQEYFAACRLKQLFSEDNDAFEDALTRLPFSFVVLDILDELLDHEQVFDYCMDRFKTALAWADQERRGIENSGHKFTWLLALRDRKGEKPGLKERLQEIFDAEKEQSNEKAIANGKFVRIHAGAFFMGGYEREDEQPVRVVYLSEYWISKYTETFKEYNKYCLASNSGKPNDNNFGRGKRPVLILGWHNADEYVSWKGEGYFLPTEAQWEKAARGKLGRKYPWGNGEPDKKICNFDADSTVKVQKLKPQMYGIYQMSGNVFEWCQDCEGDYPADRVTDPTGPKAGFDRRVLRGGNWKSSANDCRTSNRGVHDPGHPGYQSGNSGFRLVLHPEQGARQAGKRKRRLPAG